VGGHAHTLEVQENGVSIPVDNGFMVYNPIRYPNFVALLQELGVESRSTTMSFGVTIPGQVTYRGTFPNGLFADAKNIFRPRYWAFLLGIVKLRAAAKQLLRDEPAQDESLESFLERARIRKDVANWFLYPMLSAIWSIKDPEKAGQFPAMATFRFMDNHRLLDLNQPTWRTISGGSVTYVSKILDALKRYGASLETGADITRISRRADSVEIAVNGQIRNFDYVVFATHADTTLGLLTDCTDDEWAALSKFTYNVNKTVLHKDARFVSPRKNVLAAWNYTYVQNPDERQELYAEFTYCMNILQHIPAETPVYVTLSHKTGACVRRRNLLPSRIYASVA
jgi:uncharacterized protein